MGKFYSYNINENKALHFYSERGLLTFLFSNLLLTKPLESLSCAVNSLGETLTNIIKFDNTSKISVFTEFELGSEGFGSPDGALLVESNGLKSFIFIEAKAIPFEMSYIDPNSIVKILRELDPNSVGFESLLNQNKFNSSINGQIELKWRFVQAFQNSIHKSQHLITELNTKLSEEYLNVDRFYWRRNLKPNKNDPSDWRRVNMGNDLLHLYDSLKDVDYFYFLCITKDDEFPDGLKKIRFIDGNDKKISEQQKLIFWLPINFIENKLK